MSELGVKKAALIVVGLAVAGCMVGPNYHAPKASVPDGWVGTTTRPTTRMSITTPEATSIATWWENFNDPTLNGLIARAIESNLDLRQAEARIAQARAQRGVVAAGLWPTVDASGSFRRSRAGAAGSGAPTPTPQNSYQAGFDAAWELDVFGGVRRGIEAADANIQASVEDRRSVLVTLTAEVALNYVNLRGLQQQITVAKENLEVQRQTASIVRKQAVVGGFKSGLDTATAQAQVATTLAQIPLLEASAQQTIYALSVLLGREPGALLAELSPTGAIPTTPPVVPVGLPSDLLRRRPDIRFAEAQLHSATAQIGVATADLFPKFSLTGSAGLQSNTLKSFGNWDSHFWSVGPSVTWTIFDAGRILSNIRVQNALQLQALIVWEKSVLTALQDVETALIAYEKDQQRRTALTEAVAQNRTAVRIATTQYQAGLVEFLNVLTAERDLFATEESLADANRAVSADLIALYKALGGGWEDEGVSRTTSRPATRPAGER